MNDELKHAPAIERGIHAEKIITSEIYRDAYDKVRLAILAKIESSPARDVEGREHLFKMLKALRDARAVLEQAMRDGKVALHLRDQESRLSQIFRRKA